MEKTIQEKFWQSNFGKDYIKRNYYTNKALNVFYLNNFGITRADINAEFLKNLKINNLLEVGCNVGNQLSLLQSQGFKNLYGMDISPLAVEFSKKRTKNINVILGSALDIPFKDAYFDLVFTSGVLIHISLKNMAAAMKEIYRTSSRYIFGYEYFSEKYEAINYRGHKDRLWKGNFPQMYLNLFPDLRLVKEKRLKFKANGSSGKNGRRENELLSTVFLLKKIKT
ncbi:MAG: methyltransferase domain-containing protein [bacterium]|nr:methyltransferase domain-containing protein [bacterium]